MQRRICRNFAFGIASILCSLAMLIIGPAMAQTSAKPAIVNPVETPPGAPVAPYIVPDKAYLFAHMTSERYGVLFYSVSLDGLHWKRLNGGKAVSEDYHGHPSIVKLPDGRYILVGNKSDDDPLIRFWSSADLITWKPFGTYQPDISRVKGHPHSGLVRA